MGRGLGRCVFKIIQISIRKMVNSHYHNIYSFLVRVFILRFAEPLPLSFCVSSRMLMPPVPEDSNALPLLLCGRPIASSGGLDTPPPVALCKDSERTRFSFCGGMDGGFLA